MDQEEIQDSSDSESPASSETSASVWEPVSEYVKQNPDSSSTTLFSILALLKAYVPESYLLRSECHIVLGREDPIDDGPSLEKRMSPFMSFIDTQGDRVSLIIEDIAKEALDILAGLNITKLETAENLLNLLSSSDAAQFIQQLLTKRTTLDEGKTKFSEFIDECSFEEAVSILKAASNKFRNKAIYPQTIGRYYYIKGPNNQTDVNADIYGEAIKWATKAIDIAPDSSFTHDTLAQICKTLLIKDPTTARAHLALKAFKDVKRKAEAEVEPDSVFKLEEPETFPKTFNNRGRFGFIQVAKIIYKHKLNVTISAKEVEETFDFFEWYLTYSYPDRMSFDPAFLFSEVACCLRKYTSRNASKSTSFPGLLKNFNPSQHHSLKEIQRIIKLRWEIKRNVIDAERYILSNILLCNQNPKSDQLAPVEELQRITQSFISSPQLKPEFYLLVCLLFWPETQNDLQILDLQEQVKNMETAFEKEKHGKYLRGRYLVPLFFLGKGTGLTKWIHRSKLDAIVEEKATAKMSDDNLNETLKRKICNIWNSGEVWLIPQIQDLLQPVKVEPCNEQNESVWVQTGGDKIQARVEEPLDAPIQKPVRYFLGFNIRGPIVFKVRPEEKTNAQDTG